MDSNADPLLSLTAQIVASYVSHHDVVPSDLPGLIRTVYAGLDNAADETPTRKAKPSPAVPVDQSITDTHLICLEDGKPYQSLKRHLSVAYGLTPEAYREKWGLPPDYPMVAPAYARRRSELAKKSGLGRG